MTTPPRSSLSALLADAGECPRCSYALEGLESPVCPECGLELTEEVLGRAAIRNNPARPRDRLAGMIRGAAIVVAMVCLGQLLYADWIGAAWSAAGVGALAAAEVAAHWARERARGNAPGLARALRIALSFIAVGLTTACFANLSPL